MVDYFLKINGIEGESQDSRHQGEIELESFSWGESRSAHAADGVRGGKVSTQDVLVVMQFNKASPLLMLAAASGQHLTSAVLTVRMAGSQQQEILVFTFTDLMVTSYETRGSAEPPFPVDQVSFNFRRIDVAYHPQLQDGSLGAAVEVGWDVTASPDGG